MKRTINRRRFVGLLGTAGVGGTAGCMGTSDPRDDPGNSSATATAADGPTDAPEFDFPPGADDGGIVSDRILSGVRDTLATTDRYRISWTSHIDYSDGPTLTTEATEDVAGETVLEQRIQGSTRLDRFHTPEQTRCRSSEVDGNRSGKWLAAPIDPAAVGARSFHLAPFERAGLPALIDSATFDFDEIVTENGQSYARYTGTAVQRDWVRHWWDSARFAQQLESPLEGSVSLLLAQDGTVHALEYELSGTVSRTAHDGQHITNVTTRGQLRLEYGDLAEVTAPGWTESDDFRSFAVIDRGSNRVYELTGGPALPGTTNLAYAEFYVTAQVDGQQYAARFSKTQNFDVGDRLYLGINEDGLELSRFSVSGTNPLVAGEWVDISVFLFNPETGRSMIYHDEFRP